MAISQRTVLIVEDSAEDASTFQRYLERDRDSEYICYTANTVAAGLDMCRAVRPDAILLDYRMPDDTGLAFLAALAAEHGPLAFPVVMLTGSGDEAVAVQALKLGAQDYLVKKHDIQQRLILALDNAIDKVQLQRQVEQQRHDLAASNQQLRQALEAQQASAAQLDMAFQAARMTTWDMRFLSDASKALATSLDYQLTLDHIARLTIPHLSDACIIDLVGEQQQIHTVVVAHSDPEQETLLREMHSQYLPMWNDTHPAAQVLRSGQPLVINEIPQAMVDTHALNDHQRALIEQLALRSLIMLPFVVRGKTIGVLTLYATHTMRRYTSDDLALAEELARRAAMALDNAQLYQEAQEAIREREAFLLVASHEVKTPLTALLGRAQMLRRRLERKGDSARELEDVALIIDQSKRINRLLSELLDVSQVTGGQFSIDSTPLDLGSLIHHVVTEVQPAAPDHRISISEQATMLAIAGDANRLEQVFQNLISNAIKYSPAGGTIEVEIAMQDTRARITVRDQGLGIPAAALPHVFKRFYRVAGAATQPIAGSGIGLYVVREIVAGHGGTVEASSIEGAGSIFTVYLPLALVPEHVQSSS